MTIYDVAIVGGRPAGASLAARLGTVGLRVVVLERATMPSYPAVSCPLFFSSGMALLDEIGLAEEHYTENNPRCPGVVLEFRDYFRTFLQMPDLHGRDYMYGIDRALFDKALWDHLDTFETVEKRENFSVTDLIVEEGRVVGLQGRFPEQPVETINARCVVGADGRHSLVARKMDAKITTEVSDYNTALYYAYWEDVEPYSDEEWIQVHTGVDGYSFIIIPSSNGQHGVVVQCRRDYFDAPDGPEDWYLSTLQRYPEIWNRLQDAKQVSKLSGMKNIQNLYREAYGDGWVLVGDAYHQKDSFDGQGIYDALLESKILAEVLIRWHKEVLSWDEAMQSYSEQAYEATYPMFKATMDRLQREVYSEPPALVVKTLLRWILTNPDYKSRFVRLVTRDIHPEGWAPPPVMMKAIAQGIGRDVAYMFSGRKKAT